MTLQASTHYPAPDLRTATTNDLISIGRPGLKPICWFFALFNEIA
ncbi:hypothetical protein LT85_0729 [Collimonas arenae]|uniref:Uncharacterized protein n=1 Tax=Collimonas arenae TaxID=279058 RepID=A0A0A1F8A3_9BURK|nr:hypothetical protein LT85_0729 [Collimonas arenae]